MQFTVFTANCVGKRQNCSYPKRVVVTDEKSLQAAVAFDHVCAEYQGNYRSVDNFLSSDCLVMDLDNDHTDDPAEWITPEKLIALIPDVDFMMAASRHHMLPKEGKAPRPRYHVYFPILEVVKKVFRLSKENHDLKQAVIWLNQEEIPTCKAFYISQGYEYAPEANPKWNKEKVWGVIKQEGYVEPCRHYEKCMELGRHCDRMPIIDRETFEEVNKTCRYRNR